MRWRAGMPTLPRLAEQGVEREGPCAPRHVVMGASSMNRKRHSSRQHAPTSGARRSQGGVRTCTPRRRPRSARPRTGFLAADAFGDRHQERQPRRVRRHQRGLVFVRAIAQRRKTHEGTRPGDLAGPRLLHFRETVHPQFCLTDVAVRVRPAGGGGAIRDAGACHCDGQQAGTARGIA